MRNKRYCYYNLLNHRNTLKGVPKNRSCEKFSGSNHRWCSVKKDVLKNFADFPGKHLCWVLFLLKLRPPDLQLY